MTLVQRTEAARGVIRSIFQIFEYLAPNEDQIFAGM